MGASLSALTFGCGDDTSTGGGGEGQGGDAQGGQAQGGQAEGGQAQGGENQGGQGGTGEGGQAVGGQGEGGQGGGGGTDLEAACEAACETSSTIVAALDCEDPDAGTCVQDCLGSEIPVDCEDEYLALITCAGETTADDCTCGQNNQGISCTSCAAEFEAIGACLQP